MMERLVLLWILWSCLLGVLPKGLGFCVRFGMEPVCLVQLVSGMGKWVVVAATPITCHDIEFWPCSVSMLVKWVAFLGTLHWPQGRVDLGVGGVSCVEVLILYELWVGERLDLEKAVPRCCRAGRSISVSAVPFGPGTDIGRSCRYIGALFRALVSLPGVFVDSSLVRLLPITVGFGTLGGKGVAMAPPPGLVNRLRSVFFD